MSFVEQQDPSKHAVGFLFVVLLHVGIIYALVTGLGRQAIEVIRGPIQTKIIDELKPPPPDALPPPLPKLAVPPPPFIPTPEIKIQQTSSQNAITAVTNVKPVEQPQVARVVEPVRVPPVIDAARACKQPEYPVASKRLEETGAVVLQFLIGVDGSVVESKVETSSGHSRLDEAAADALSRCKFKAGTVDGKPEQSWARLRYVWKLE
jgi:protein TonB